MSPCSHEAPPLLPESLLWLERCVLLLQRSPPLLLLSLSGLPLLLRSLLTPNGLCLWSVCTPGTFASKQATVAFRFGCLLLGGDVTREAMVCTCAMQLPTVDSPGDENVNRKRSMPKRIEITGELHKLFIWHLKAVN
jgi:hypothetical protein